MKREVFDKWGKLKLREEEATPECGEDFCDRCGDCLHCYAGDDPCYPDGGPHRWIAYESPREAFAQAVEQRERQRKERGDA